MTGAGPIAPASVVQIKNLDGCRSGFLMSPEAARHSLQIVYGAITSRPEGHERCVLCDAAFGKGQV